MINFKTPEELRNSSKSLIQRRGKKIKDQEEIVIIEMSPNRAWQLTHFLPQGGEVDIWFTIKSENDWEASIRLTDNNGDIWENPELADLPSVKPLLDLLKSKWKKSN